MNALLEKASPEQAIPDTGIEGVRLLPVTCRPDGRGCLTELFRASWPGAFPTVQWNACDSRAGVVRGVHVHVDYDEVYTMPVGHVVLALHDIRPESPTRGQAFQLDWRAGDGIAVTIPRGVAHAMLCVADSLLVMGLSSYWSGDFDTLGCQYDDPRLDFAWPAGEVVRSERDRRSGTYEQMLLDYVHLRRAWLAMPSHPRDAVHA